MLHKFQPYKTHQLQFSSVWLELNASIRVIRHLRRGAETAAATATANSVGEKAEAEELVGGLFGGVLGSGSKAVFEDANLSARPSSR